MNRVVLSLVDGTGFFVGLATVLFGDLALLWFRTGVLRSVLSVFVLVGLILVVISATPLPLWAYGVWLGAGISTLMLCTLGPAPRRGRILAAGALCATTAGLCVAEAPFHRAPRLAVPAGSTVYVLGDSISAGTGTGEQGWPAALADITSLSVVNLAVPGATIQSAIRQAQGISTSNSVVILEIGGNDLLGGTDPAAFREQLEVLVASLRAGNHQLIMFELPLLPFQNAFGKAQRDVASEHQVVLIPKRYLASVLGMKGGTLDGLHLSQEGHYGLAARVAELLSP